MQSIRPFNSSRHAWLLAGAVLVSACGAADSGGSAIDPDALLADEAAPSGGARGQGAEEGRLFAAEGATVVLTDVLDDEATVAEVLVGGRAEHEWAGDARVRDVVAGLVADIGWQAPVGTLSCGKLGTAMSRALISG